MPFQTDSPDRIYGATEGISVTPSDSADLSIEFSRGILVGSSGALRAALYSGTIVTFPNLVAGVIHPICATRIYSTGTTAGGIVAVK